MASAETDILEYMLWLYRSCLSLTPAALKNPIFATVFGTQVVLEQLFSDSLLAFAPRLLNVLQSTTPPSIDYFKTLPTDTRKR